MFEEKLTELREQFESIRAEVEREDIEVAARQILRDGYEVLFQENRGFADEIDELSQELDRENVVEAEQEARWDAEDAKRS